MQASPLRCVWRNADRFSRIAAGRAILPAVVRITVHSQGICLRGRTWLLQGCSRRFCIRFADRSEDAIVERRAELAKQALVPWQGSHEAHGRRLAGDCALSVFLANCESATVRRPTDWRLPVVLELTLRLHRHCLPKRAGDCAAFAGHAETRGSRGTVCIAGTGETQALPFAGRVCRCEGLGRHGISRSKER